MAPEKISISPAGVVYQGERQSEYDIEYTRTDGFIEKAANWLRCHPSSHYDDLEEFAIAFKKAMKLYD